MTVRICNYYIENIDKVFLYFYEVLYFYIYKTSLSVLSVNEINYQKYLKL